MYPIRSQLLYNLVHTKIYFLVSCEAGHYILELTNPRKKKSHYSMKRQKLVVNKYHFLRMLHVKNLEGNLFRIKVFIFQCRKQTAFG